MNFVVNLLLFYINFLFNWMDFLNNCFVIPLFCFCKNTLHREGTCITILNTVACISSLLAK